MAETPMAETAAADALGGGTPILEARGLHAAYGQVRVLHGMDFIVNTGGATAADIHAVISHVKKTVLEKTSVALKTEVVYLGDWG